MNHKVHKDAQRGTKDEVKVVMGRFVYLLVVVVLAITSYGQIEVQNAPLKVTMCDLYEHPEQYAGKMVQFRANAGFDFSLDDRLDDKPCSTYMNIHLEFTGNINPIPSFATVRDRVFNEFVENVRQGMWVNATYEGRFDPLFVWRDQKRIRVGQGTEKGYGKKHHYDGRVVLQRVADVRAFPILRPK